MAKTEYNGIACDSTEEKLFLMWAFEMKDKGLITSIERAPTFILSEPVYKYVPQVIQLKTKLKVITKKVTVLNGHVYTPEFIIRSDLQPDTILDMFEPTEYQGERVWIIEVKPEYDQHNMTRLNQINRKWLYKDQGIFTNLVKPRLLFESTFYPEGYVSKKAVNRKTIDQWFYNE